MPPILVFLCVAPTIYHLLNNPSMAVSNPDGHPDIEYMPYYDKYLARGKRRQETEKLDKHLPKGFPSHLCGSLVWDPDTIAISYDWNYHLTVADLDEINNALRHFKCMLSVD